MSRMGLRRPLAERNAAGTQSPGGTRPSFSAVVRPLAMLALLLALLPPPALSQPRASQSISVQLTIRVTLDKGQALRIPVRVQVSSGGSPAAEAFTDDRGEVRFNVNPGAYRITVSGPDIEEVTTESVAVDSQMGTHFEFIRVQFKPGVDPSSMQSSIAVVDINVPGKAQKEFSKGTEALFRNNFPEARERFTRAISLYPHYATAYNYLGLTEIKSGHSEPAQAAFEQATKLNEHYTDAYLNLGKLMYQQEKFPQAAIYLTKVLTTDPENLAALTMIARTQLVAGKYDLALANARKVNASKPPHPSLAHLIAAQALELKGDSPSSVAEYKAFLKESPDNPLAPKIKEAVERYEQSRAPSAAAKSGITGPQATPPLPPKKQ